MKLSGGARTINCDTHKRSAMSVLLNAMVSATGWFNRLCPERASEACCARSRRGLSYMAQALRWGAL